MKSLPEGITDVALSTWKKLGPITFFDIVENSNEKINFSLKKVGTSSENPSIQGQIFNDEYGTQDFVGGIGRQIFKVNGSIYEGQFKNEIKHGYGR